MSHPEENPRKDKPMQDDDQGKQQQQEQEKRRQQQEGQDQPMKQPGQPGWKEQQEGQG